jgi:hypothetical protein
MRRLLRGVYTERDEVLAITKLVCLCHLRNGARFFRVIALDFRQVAGKQLSRDDAH